MEDQEISSNKNPNKDAKMLKPKISIFGVGGAGGNALNNMIQSNLDGADFIAVNTDSQALSDSLAANRIQLGENLTKGLGAGSFPDVGRQAAEESIDEILQYIEGSSMVFVTAGMGGGTGTGASPVIAKLAKERDILTVAVITKPFHFEGKGRMDAAESGIEELKKYVDTIIVIPNQNLFRISNEQTTFESAFKMADDILHTGVRGITDLIVKPGLINLDFADIRTIMTKGGKAIMGTGEAKGEDRALIACEAAISNPLLDDISIKGAKGVLVNMTGGTDITLFEADLAVNRIKQEVDENATIIFGTAFKEDMQGMIRISVVATGIEIEAEDSKKYSPKIMTSQDVKSSVAAADQELIDKVSETKSTFFDPGMSRGGDELEVENDLSKEYEENVVNNPNLEVEEQQGQKEKSETIFSNIQEKISKIEKEKKFLKKKKDKQKKEKSAFGLFAFMNAKKDKNQNIYQKEEEIVSNNIEQREQNIVDNIEENVTKASNSNNDNQILDEDLRAINAAEHDDNSMDEILSVPAFLRKK